MMIEFKFLVIKKKIILNNYIKNIDKDLYYIDSQRF